MFTFTPVCRAFESTLPFTSLPTRYFFRFFFFFFPMVQKRTSSRSFRPSLLAPYSSQFDCFCVALQSVVSVLLYKAPLLSLLKVHLVFHVPPGVLEKPGALSAGLPQHSAYQPHQGICRYHCRNIFCTSAPRHLSCGL